MNKVIPITFQVLVVLIPLAISSMNTFADVIKYSIFATGALILYVEYVFSCTRQDITPTLSNWFPCKVLKIFTLWMVMQITFNWNTCFSMDRAILMSSCIAIFFTATTLSVKSIHKIFYRLIQVAIPISFIAIIENLPWFDKIINFNQHTASLICYSNSLVIWTIAVLVITAYFLLYNLKSLSGWQRLQIGVSASLQIWSVFIDRGCFVALTFLSMAVFFVAIAVIRSFCKTRIIIAAALLIPACAMFFWQGSGTVKEATRRYTTGKDRAIYYPTAIRMIKDKSLGAGLGAWERDFPANHSSERFKGRHAVYPHCEILDIGVEYGIPGIILYLLFVGSVFYCGYKNRQNPLISFTAIAFALLLLHGQIDRTARHAPIALLHWLFAGIIVSHSNRNTKTPLFPAKTAYPLRAITIIALTLSAIMSWFLWHEDTMIKAGRSLEIANPKTAFATYAKFGMQVRTNTETKYLATRVRDNLPLYRLSDYFLSLYCYSRKDLRGARGYLKNHKTFVGLMDGNMKDYEKALTQKEVERAIHDKNNACNP